MLRAVLGLGGDRADVHALDRRCGGYAVAVQAVERAGGSAVEGARVGAQVDSERLGGPRLPSLIAVFDISYVEPVIRTGLVERRAFGARSGQRASAVRTLGIRRSGAQGADAGPPAGRATRRADGEFVLPLRVEHRTGHGSLVGELLGQGPVEQGAAGVGEADVSDAAVAGVAAAFDQAALGELFEAFGDGGTGGERSRGPARSGVSSWPVRRRAPSRSNSGRLGRSGAAGVLGLLEEGGASG